MDCGKQFSLAAAEATGEDNIIDGESIARCPRCLSDNIREHVEASHENIVVDVPKDYSEHPLETKARELFDRVTELTEWREPKVRLWFQLANPLLGNVSPEWMILNGNADRLEVFIKEAEADRAEYMTC